MNVDGVVISSSDARLGTVNRNTIENKVKRISSKIILNTLDRKEELEKSK